LLSEGEIIVRLVMSVIIGGFIGLERERHHVGYKTHSAGFRTHILVCIGSALAMIVSIGMHYEFKGDAGRIAAQVVSGIGFLGAGAIMKEGQFVRGLTTAASLWVVASLGLACGAGYYLAATLGTFLVLFALVLLGAFEYIWRRDERYETISIVTSDRPQQVGMIGSFLEKGHGVVKRIEVCKTGEDGRMHLEICLKTTPDDSIVDIMQSLAAMPGVYSVEHRA